MIKVKYNNDEYLIEMDIQEFKYLKDTDIVCIVDTEFNQGTVYKQDVTVLSYV